MANAAIGAPAMTDFPRSLIEFQRRFPDDGACAAYLAAARWPDGFRCPACGHDKGWELASKPFTWECAGCGRQTSVTAGTVMHGSKLALTIWFWAAYLMATHSNGISALQLLRQLGLGSYKTAWLLCAKLRRAMVAPDRNPLAGIVDVDETMIPYRTREEPVAGGCGRSGDGKMLIAGAVEVVGNMPGRVRLAAIVDFSATSLHAFVKANVAQGTTARTDGWPGYAGIEEINHDPHTVGAMAAHTVLPWAHRIFANLKRWALGVYHGLRKKHLQSYLDEFVFRFNRRRTRHAAFRSLLDIAVALKSTTYNMLIAPEVTA
jgi:transposase-like protein